MTQLKDILKYYLGTGLKVKVNPQSMYYLHPNASDTAELIGWYGDDTYLLKQTTGNVDLGIEDFKPCLFNVSMLTEQIEHNGIKKCVMQDILSQHQLEMDISIEFDKWELYECKFWILEILINHHFNVFNLEPDQYIDKRKL